MRLIFLKMLVISGFIGFWRDIRSYKIRPVPSDTKFHIDSFLSISEKSRYTFIISFVDSLGKSCAAKIEDGDFIGLAKSV